MWGPSRCSMRKEALGALASYHEAPQTPGELALSLFSLQRGKLRPIGGVTSSRSHSWCFLGLRLESGPPALSSQVPSTP